MSQYIFKNKLLTFAILAMPIALVLSSYIIYDGMIDMKKMDRIVEVKGLSERTVRSNVANWTVSFTVNDDNLVNLNNSLESNQNLLKEYLISNGVNESSITVVNSTVIDNWNSQMSGNGKAQHYQMIGSLTVNTNDIDSVIKANSNINSLINKNILLTTNYINYYYTDFNSVKNIMLDEALANSKKSADLIALKTTSKIGDIKYSNQGVFSITSPSSDYNDPASVDKKIRVVTTVQYYLK